MIKCLQCGADNPAGNTFCQNCGKPILAVGSGGAALQTLSGLRTIGGGETLHHDAYPKGDVAILEPGAVFAGRYTIESRIGIGGMGVVYRAKDKIGDRIVALKLIRSDRLSGEDAVSRLSAEGVLTQDIRHKNIVNVYHVDQFEGQPFLSMEFVEGVSLREWIRKQKRAGTEVGLMVAARIVNEVLAGLQVAHEMGIVHRDLKPENIMLTAEPSADAAALKILDFGIARVEARQVVSGTGREGTVEYMAPEQITDADSAGPEADFYSLSIIFYELLVGVLPKGGWQPRRAAGPTCRRESIH